MCDGLAQVFDFWFGERRGNRGHGKLHQQGWFNFNPRFNQGTQDRFFSMVRDACAAFELDARVPNHCRQGLGKQSDVQVTLIERFMRFPHPNNIRGRTSTKVETHVFATSTQDLPTG